MKEIEEIKHDNPDLPESFIINAIKAKKEADSGKLTRYKRRGK